MVGRSVSPHDCALVFGVPLSRSSFIRDLQGSTPKDLVKSLAGPVEPLTTADAVRLYNVRYAPFARLAEGVARESRQLGVKVYREIRLDELSRVISAHPVVTLVAHWRFLPLSPSDVLDLPGFNAILKAATDSDAESVRPIDAELCNQPDVRGAMSAAELAAALNRRLQPSVRYYQWSESAAQPGDVQMPAMAGITRVLLEEMYPNCFTAGPCLELTDRLCTAWEFIARVPPEFDGVLDLTVCNSLILAEAIKRQRPHCTILAAKQPAVANVRLTLYRHAIRLLAGAPRPYEDAMAIVHAALTSHIRQSGQVNS